MMNEDEAIFDMSMGQGCPVHGDEHMRECSMCGAEFCRLCNPRMAVCADCAEEANEEDDDEPDFDDVERLDDLLAGDLEEPDDDDEGVEEDEDDDEGLRGGRR